MAKLEDTDNTIVMHVLCNSTSVQLKSKMNDQEKVLHQDEVRNCERRGSE
jgi:hypothetical protein